MILAKDITPQLLVFAEQVSVSDLLNSITRQWYYNIGHGERLEKNGLSPTELFYKHHGSIQGAIEAGHLIHLSSPNDNAQTDDLVLYPRKFLRADTAKTTSHSMMSFGLFNFVQPRTPIK